MKGAVECPTLHPRRLPLRGHRAAGSSPVALGASHAPPGWFMRRASSLVGLPFDEPGGLMADAGGNVLPVHRRAGSRSRTMLAGSTNAKDRRPRRRMSVNRRRFITLCVVLTAALVLRIVTYFATWYPGDETIRNCSESFLRLMFSRSGVSFGVSKSYTFNNEVKLEASDEIQTTKRDAVVQGKISERPRWEVGKNLNVSAEAELNLNNQLTENCFFRVHLDEPVVTLYDDGKVHEYRLNGAGGGDSSVKSSLDVEHLTCSHFRAISFVSWSRMADGESFHPTPPPVVKDSQSGRVLLINSATTLGMLSEYHRPLLNHQAYAESNGYGYVLALVKPSSLHGRSGKFAKHLALGAQLAKQRSSGGARDDGDSIRDSSKLPSISIHSFQSVCHMDLDAWFASWAPFSAYGDFWDRDKDFLFGDAGQIWLNTGLLCARPTPWAVQFFDRVVNAVFSGVEVEDTQGVEEETRMGRPVDSNKYVYGFQRDQPAVWHVLAQTWHDENGVPYQAQSCTAWHRACNPKENPIECWHWCHWDALQRWDGWTGELAASIHKLNRVQLAPRFDARKGDVKDFFDSTSTALSTRTNSPPIPPPMHRMCLRSCKSVLSRIGMGLCGAVSGNSPSCFPTDVDKMSLCDGSGCLKQMATKGGGWIKHTGHQHWRDTLPSCVPVSEEEAEWERANPKKACA